MNESSYITNRLRTRTRVRLRTRTRVVSRTRTRASRDVVPRRVELQKTASVLQDARGAPSAPTRFSRSAPFGDAATARRPPRPRRAPPPRASARPRRALSTNTVHSASSRHPKAQVIRRRRTRPAGTRSDRQVVAQALDVVAVAQRADGLRAEDAPGEAERSRGPRRSTSAGGTSCASPARRSRPPRAARPRRSRRARAG